MMEVSMTTRRVPPISEIDEKNVYGTIDENGREILDPVPMAPSVGYVGEPSILLQVRQMIRDEHYRLAAEAQGWETFEEADDFDVGDDNPPTHYENEGEDPFRSLDADARMFLRQKSYRAEVERRAKQLEDEANGTQSQQGRDSVAGGGDRLDDSLGEGDQLEKPSPSNEGRARSRSKSSGSSKSEGE